MKEVKKIYPEKESKLLEFKEKLTDWNKIVKTCVAFANGSGGELVIGVKDETREIIGISTKEEDDFYESIPNKIFDTISPAIIPDIYEKNFGKRNVFIIRIHQGSKKPYYLKKEGPSSGVYVRVGPHTRKLPPDEIEILLNISRGISYDSEAVDAPILSVKNSSTLQELYNHKLSSQLLEREGILKKDSHGKLHVTRAALLMFADTPSEFIPEAIIICSLFRGEIGRDIIQTREISGAIPILINDAISIINSWLEKDFRFKRAKYAGKIPIPEIALREAIINALIHRKYSIAGAVKIAIYENRIEIFSPGQFPSTITPENLGDGSTVLRNPLLAKFARKLHLIEKLGSGIKTIFEECKKEKIRRPEFLENGDFVKVIFYFEKDTALKNDLAEIIKNEFKERETLRIEDILKIANVSRNTVTNTFRDLMSKNIVERVGKGRGVFYKLRDS